MLIPPKYELTPKIVQLLQSVEASKEVIDSIQIPPEVELNIRRQSTLTSSLFSARIEGNPLSLEELARSSSKDQRRVEVFNILRALNWVHQRRYRDVTTKDILELHRITMTGLAEAENLGKFRNQTSAIFNTAGIAVYLPPRPTQILPLVERLVRFISSSKEPFVPIRACLTHYIFEKIHPFLDGNGRVGRLLLQLVARKGDYGMKGLLTMEEHLDNHRGEYYRALENPERDVTDYLEFMLEAIATGAQEAKQLVLQKQEIQPEDLLLPRRAEIFNIIKEHGMVNFDQIRRRFMAVNERTLRYDIKKLVDSGFVRKRGATRGVCYEPATPQP